MTEIKYKDTTISIGSGKIATLHLANKKLTEDMVITIPEQDVLEEWDGSYIVSGGVELISFTIDGDHYEAEDGMTWSEWVDSSYNTVEAVHHVAEGIPCVSIGAASSGMYVMAVCDIHSNVVPSSNAIIADYAYTIVQKRHSGGAG